MVKDTWAHSTIQATQANYEPTKTIHQIMTNKSADVQTSYTTESNQMSQINHYMTTSSAITNPWGEYGSRENFIDMHFC
jgi:hypothetical protein